MNSAEIRTKFLKFFEDRGHKIVPSASLVAPEEKSVTDKTLFIGAGMQPLIPYLLGKPHPLGKRLVNIQKCIRMQDIDEVGDKTHDTFFEMMGNWSLGDYFKEDAIKWSFELLTNSKEKGGFGLDSKRLYITVFEGNKNAPRDIESAEIWKKVGIPENRIYFMSAKTNWWSAGDNGPCGPDSEMFYDINGTLGDLTKEEYIQADKNQKAIEIWNDVFMEYEQKDGKVIGKLANRNVDTGAGLERLAMVLQGKDNLFETDLFALVIANIKIQTKPIGSENLLNSFDHVKARRIIADHIRTAVFMVGDGVIPSNTDRGYILRRLIRRAATLSYYVFGIQSINYLVEIITPIYKDVYPELLNKQSEIESVIWEEEHKFRKTLIQGMKEFGRGTDAFTLFTSYGFPFELTKELAKEKGIEIDEKGFQEKFEKHQEISRVGSEQKFKGGLAGHSEMEVKYHTATHMLHQALHDVLGDEVGQKGSNITTERLRFDFSFPRKLTDDEKKKVEDIVNQKITKALPMQNIILPKAEAEKTGARHFFDQKYPDQVSIYFIGDSLESAWSKEFCGGPHVKNTGELGHFKITKEEAVSAGVRRIKAVLQ